ncbi:MAG: T9SS type A sorting domain-containing protein [Saprospirales bacterium]|nr:T9SS type A sorting domain-containing protein [Saprospirales bacterium]
MTLLFPSMVAPLPASRTIELNPALEWEIYPNPASDLLHISQAPDEILIADLLGRVIQLQRFSKSDTNTQVTIDLNGLPSGSYFLLARREGQQTALKRFVVLK